MKTKVVCPPKSTFLGFAFWEGADRWKARLANDRKKKLYDKTREILCRKRTTARPISVTFIKLNQLIRGWVNYFGIGSMKGFYEGLQRMDAAQGQGSHLQAVEEAENHLPESAKAESVRQVRIHR